MPKPARVQNTPRQPAKNCTTPPSCGASTGARPMIRVISDSTRAVSAWLKRSRTTARAITAPAQPPRAWTKRAAIRVSMFGARAQTTEATKKTTIPTNSGRRRPKRSEAGP